MTSILALVIGFCIGWVIVKVLCWLFGDFLGLLIFIALLAWLYVSTPFAEAAETVTPPTPYNLVLFFHVGPMGDGNSNAVTYIPYETEAGCEQAGRLAGRLVSGTVKSLNYICLPAK